MGPAVLLPRFHFSAVAEVYIEENALSLPRRSSGLPFSSAVEEVVESQVVGPAVLLPRGLFSFVAEEVVGFQVSGLAALGLRAPFSFARDRVWGSCLQT